MFILAQGAGPSYYSAFSCYRTASRVMAQLAVLIAGLLRIAVSQARDVEEADPSTVQGFLSKHMPAVAQRASTSLNVYVPQGLSESEYRAAKSTEQQQKSRKDIITRKQGNSFFQEGFVFLVQWTAIGQVILFVSRGLDKFELFSMFGVRILKFLRCRPNSA